MSLAGGIWKEFQQMQVCSLPPHSSRTNVKPAVFVLRYHLQSIRKFEVTWRTLRTITHSLMVHVQFLESYIHFVIMYTSDPVTTNQRPDKQIRRANHTS